MVDEINNLPRCRVWHKLSTGQIVQCPHPVKYAGERRCEDCFVDAQIPNFWKRRTVAQHKNVRIVERTPVNPLERKKKQKCRKPRRLW